MWSRSRSERLMLNISRVGSSQLDYEGGFRDPSRAGAVRRRAGPWTDRPPIRLARKSFGPALAAKIRAHRRAGGGRGPRPIGRRLGMVVPCGPAQAHRQPAIGPLEAIAIVLIGLDAPLEPRDGLVSRRQSAQIIEGPVGVVPVLG